MVYYADSYIYFFFISFFASFFLSFFARLSLCRAIHREAIHLRAAHHTAER